MYDIGMDIENELVSLEQTLDGDFLIDMLYTKI